MKESDIQQAVISVQAMQVVECNFISKIQFDPTITVNANHLQLKHTCHNVNENKNLFVIEFIANVTNPDQTLTINVVFKTLFRYSGEVTEEFLKSKLAGINAPAIAYPFLRSFITTISANAGFVPIILPAINFAKSKILTPGESPKSES